MTELKVIRLVTDWKAWAGKHRNVQGGQAFKTCERSVGSVSVRATQLRL